MSVVRAPEKFAESGRFAFYTTNDREEVGKGLAALGFEAARKRIAKELGKSTTYSRRSGLQVLALLIWRAANRR